jgi:uncharacterized protein (TIGR03086 family)
MLVPMVSLDDGLVARFVTASDGFARRVRLVADAQWSERTPCTDWDVRALVNHVAQGNLNYIRLLHGATAADFLRLRDADALGSDPVGAFVAAARECAEAYAAAGALEQVVDHPSGKLTGRQALAVRTTDTVIHTWDLARAIGVDDTLDPDLLAWIDENILEIYAGMVETPVSTQTTHRFYAPPQGDLPPGSSTQDRLLDLFGRPTNWRA